MKEKQAKRESVRRNCDIFSKNGGCLNSSPLLNRIVVPVVLGGKVCSIFELICKSCFRRHEDVIFFGGAVHLVVKGRPATHFWGRFSSIESTAERRRKRGSKSAKPRSLILLIDITRRLREKTAPLGRVAVTTFA